MGITKVMVVCMFINLLGFDHWVKILEGLRLWPLHILIYGNNLSRLIKLISIFVVTSTTKICPVDNIGTFKADQVRAWPFPIVHSVGNCSLI